MDLEIRELVRSIMCFRIILKSPAVYTHLLPWYSKSAACDHLYHPLPTEPWQWDRHSESAGESCVPLHSARLCTVSIPSSPLGFLDWLIPSWMTHSSFARLIQSIRLHSYFMAWKPAYFSQVTFFFLMGDISNAQKNAENDIIAYTCYPPLRFTNINSLFASGLFLLR